MHSPHRIDYLDGLRGLAILLVLGFHGYFRWADHMPYGQAAAHVPLFEYGWLGVRLFFLISGFVILMTLERSPDWRTFLIKRWLRLFPAMLICSALIFATSPWLTQRPSGQPGLINLLPGLSLIDPDWWAKLLRHEIRPLEGSFWSLFVEFKFYVFAAAAYALGKRPALFAGLVLAWLSALLARWQLAPGWLNSLAVNASFEHFGWFAGGAAFYLHVQEGGWRWLLAGLLQSSLAALLLPEPDPWVPIWGLLTVQLFALPLVSETARRILSHPALLFLGFSSYPLYLLHENALVSLVAQSGPLLPGRLALLLPLPVVALLTALAWWIARHAEPALRRSLQALPQRLALGGRGGRSA